MDLKKLIKGSGSGPSPVKVTIAGLFMGLANLVPGVSGGTMILALGLYEEFIEAFSSLTRFKFTRKNITLVVHLFLVSFITIFALAGVIQFLMENFLSEMLALFIGLTLGGAPMLKREIGKLGVGTVISTIVGIGIMAVVAFVLKPGGSNANMLLYFLGGFIGSAAMILPGISGSYLLLVMGLYLPIISAINDFKHALKTANMEAVMSVSVDILIPFGVGLVLGIVFLSNLLKFLLNKKKNLTLALLLGILLGSVLGLYPFKTQDFSKLPRHQSECGILFVKVYGVKEGEKNEAVGKIRALEDDNLEVFINYQNKNVPEKSDFIEFRKNNEKGGNIVIVYNQNIPREVRDYAKDKKLGKIPLFIVPDTSFSVLRLLLALVLAAIGFFTTKLLGKKENAQD